LSLSAFLLLPWVVVPGILLTAVQKAVGKAVRKTSERYSLEM
jgi:hypothetical protein